MNTATRTELVEVEKAQSAVDAMAVVTLSPEKYAAEVYEPFKSRLVSAIDSVRTINYDITTTAGMSVAVKCRALFRDMRVAANKERDARKKPITRIGKLLESGFDQVEERITPLEVMFDADIQAELERKEVEKVAKIAAERARTEAIEGRIQAIRNVPLAMIGKSSADILAARDAMRDTIITEELFGEQSYRDKAMEARSDAFNALEAAFDAAEKAEQAALAAEEARKAEAKRAADEAAAVAKQKVENERIANEQAAERQRLANLAAAQEAEARRVREQAAANLKAEQDALAEQVRLQREAAAEAQRKLDAQQAEIDAKRAAFVREQGEAAARVEAAIKMDADHAEALLKDGEFNAECKLRLESGHAEALEMIAQGDADREAERIRLQALADQHLTDKRDLPRPESASLHDEMVDAGMRIAELSDEDIIEFGKEWDLDLAELVARMERFVADQRKLAEVSDALPGGQHYSTTTFKDNGEPILLNADGSRSIFCDLCD